MTCGSDRISRLKARRRDLWRLSEDGGSEPAECELLRARAWLEAADEPWTVMRRAREVAAVLRGMTPVIDDEELLAGKYCLRPATTEELAELGRYRESGARARPPVWGQRAHMAIDFDTLLRVGTAGISAQIEEYRAALDLTRPEHMEKDAFYRACLLALAALVDCSHNYADLAELQAREAAGERRRELLALAEVCRRVPEYPARTFYEAVQCAHFVTFALCAGHNMLLMQLGRPDRYLLPFYRRDVAAGRLTADEAQELIDCLGLMLSEYTPRGLAVGWLLGGRDASGTDVCNELTTMFLRSIGHIRLAYPCVGLCWSSQTPAEVMELACELLAQGLSHPALFNDEVITEGLRLLGLPPAEACLYQQSTCVEITPIASSNVYVASPYINLLWLLHDMLGLAGEDGNNGLPSVEPKPLIEPRPATFAALLEGYRRRLAHEIRQAVIAQNTAQATRRYNGGFPLLSCFVNDCLARGKDIDHGGARYNWIEPSFVGLANLVDALAAIRQFVYEDQVVSLDDLVAALEDDFAGREDLRLMLLNRAPKYGNDDDSVDDLAVLVTGWITEEVRRYQTYLGGRFVSGFFCWIMHERLGRVTCASADGRHAGSPLGDGSGAAQGRERRGPTAALLSATKWDHRPHIGGIAVNLKLSPARDTRELARRLMDVVTTFLSRGGFEVQVNVVDRQTLLAARERPEDHRDLVVRIGGYSDYFVGLSPQMQDEIIARSEHEL